MKFRNQINICNFYIALWVIYAIHWSNGYIPGIEAISNAVLGINLVISLYYTVVALRNYQLPKLFKAINVVLVIFIVYGLIYMVFGETKYIGPIAIKKGTYIVSALRSFLPIYAFYVFTMKGYLTPKVMKFWTFVFLAVFIFIFSRVNLLYRLMYSKDEMVNNTGYLFAVIIPCVYYWRKNTAVQLALIGVCFVFVLLALKRGAMLTTTCVILMYLGYKMKNAKRMQKFGVIFVTIIASVFAYNFVVDRLASSALFNERIAQTIDGNTSNRDHLTSAFLQYYAHEATLTQQIVGSGADATLDIDTNWAHNDWIEILICQGIIGVIVYAYFWISFFKQWRRTREPQSRMIIGSYFVIYFVRTIVSMTYAMLLTIASIGIGYSLATDQKYLSQKRNHREL